MLPLPLMVSLLVIIFQILGHDRVRASGVKFLLLTGFKSGGAVLVSIGVLRPAPLVQLFDFTTTAREPI